MLTLKDLSASKALDHKAMSEVRGGSTIVNNTFQGSSQSASAGLVAVAQGTQHQLVSNIASDYIYNEENFVGLGNFGVVFP